MILSVAAVGVHFGRQVLTVKASKPRLTTENDKVIGERIRTQRLIKGITQADLGNVLGVSFQQIQKYEQGKNRVSSTRIGQLAKALGVHVMQLLGDTGPTFIPKSTPFSQFVSSREGIELIEALMKIENAKIRRSIVSLAESLTAR
jgi:transcriptional regulator with XRE-family HTH domain